MRKSLFLIIALCSISLVSGQNWQTDFNKAKEIAATEDKPIVLVFQGSDWCAPCMKLDREVWSTDVFKEYAESHFVMLQADFPRKRKNALSKEQQKANALLAERYNKNGIFPFVVVLDATGKELGQTSYKKTTPEDYIKQLVAFTK
jgi:thioredoxin-related protein